MMSRSFSCCLPLSLLIWYKTCIFRVLSTLSQWRCQYHLSCICFTCVPANERADGLVKEGRGCKQGDNEVSYFEKRKEIRAVELSVKQMMTARLALKGQDMIFVFASEQDTTNLTLSEPLFDISDH